MNTQHTTTIAPTVDLNERMRIFDVNGVRMLHHKNSSFLTNIQILTAVGSAAEDDPNQGMAHILEHMFFKGSQKRPGGTAISRAANDIGAKMNAYTTYDHTVYYINVLNDNFEQGFDILADMYLNPLFPPEEFAKELNPILSEYREREDDPENFIAERALEQYFGANYHPVIGTEESIRGATVDMMHAFKNRYYGGNNCMVAIAGGVDEDSVRDVVARLFPSSRHTDAPPPIQAETSAGELVLTKPGIQEAYYQLFFPAYGPLHPDRYKQEMMNYLLGGNDSALLFERIREELGMSCYGIYSWSMRHDPYSLIGISCGIAPDELDQLHKEVMNQIKRIMDERLEPDRLERGKASLRTSIAARSETSAGLNSMVGVPVLRGETEHPVLRAQRELESVTLEDIRDQAQKTLSGPMFKAVLLPA
ncbi:MAG: insulinase family protein [Leptospiraceae bacterium]|nr:insulinase family protein [Leptospiraceae bacterium]